MIKLITSVLLSGNSPISFFHIYSSYGHPVLQLKREKYHRKNFLCDFETPFISVLYHSQTTYTLAQALGYLSEIDIVFVIATKNN